MPKEAKNITLVIASLSSGGAERVMTNIANFWAGSGKTVTLLTFDDGSVAPFYKLDSRVRHEALGLPGITQTGWQRVRQHVERILRLRQALAASKPDRIISFITLTNLFTLLATRGLGVPVIVSERTDPHVQRLSKAWERMRFLFYPMAARIVVQTSRAAAFFPKRLKSRISVIPNPAVVHPMAPSVPLRLPSPGIITVGRLSPEKGHDTLIEAFALLAERFPDWSLTILGEGKWRADLEALRDAKGLEDRVAMPGRIQDPFGVMRQAEFFVLSSRREGFPNALCEAMSCGLPVVATDCPSGPREIVRDGVDGFLVPPDDPQALANAMERLMIDAEVRQRLASSALDIVERFSEERIMAMWEEAIQSTRNH